MARNKFDVDETLEKESEFNFAHIKRLASYFGKYKRQVIACAFIMIISSLMALAGPYFLKIMIDDALTPPNLNPRLVIILGLILLAFFIINLYFIRYKINTMCSVGNGIVADLRSDLFKHLQDLPFSYYDSRPHGKILVRVVNYVNSLSDMLANGIINVFTDLFSLVLIVVIMFAMNVKLALICMAGLPLLLLTTYIIKVKQRTAWRINSAKQSNMNAYIHESIAGIRVTQGFAREERNNEIFHTVTEEVRTSWLKACYIQFLMWPSAENISVWTMALLYGCGIYWITGGNGITVGLLVAFIGYIGRFWGPINNIANFYNSIIVNMSYLERIFETLDEPVVVKDEKGAAAMPQISGEVRFDRVDFCYDPDVYILKEVSFSCKAGDTVALVGPTGAGKTTIVNLISRFYNLSGGHVMIDNIDISQVTLFSLRSQMGIMMQDSFIFAGTIADNIRYSKTDATDEEVVAAAKTVCAHDFITRMENGYYTQVNERGSRLSVGERQLISFARALLCDPKILILDEATSSIDAQTEIELQKGLNELLKGRTSFIIAHRLSTIKNADKIMFIDKGRICESGTHEELMENKGAYYELYGHTA